MQSKLQFYHFQNEILDKFESELDRGDKKIHIVAPPGSGKTIMGIEMINRLIKKGVHGNVLILVPNITLQYQWKEKIENYFLEDSEKIDELISTDRSIIKKINILTYQSISQSEVDTDDFFDQILQNWYDDLKGEFKDYNDFLYYTETLKETDIKEYGENISNYKKKIKLSNTKDVLSDNVKEYLEQLKANGISSIIVDEAHHLTSFWSKVLYHIWQFLDKPFIVGLTATPPFDDSDFFVLNDDYTALLGEVDYYVPTPAIVKAGRLAPYNDLVYFVEPGETLKDMMIKNDILITEYVENNKKDICDYLYPYIVENYDKLLKNSQTLALNYIKFLYNYGEKKDISDYAFSDLIFEKITLDDIAKSVGKYVGNVKGKKIENEDDIKNMFYNLGYIWRANNFYRFRTPIEMALIYSKSKIDGVNVILKKEIENKGNTLKGAIITDFLDEGENNYINAKYILQEVNKSYPELKTILVSGQGIWQFENNNLVLLDTDILEVTKKLENGEVNLVVGTRGILGEGWDCPKLNVLIDLTGVSAYMSVNQIRGRGIRLDHDNPKKVANIYDIICLSNGYKGLIDYERVEKKYENFYGVDSSGLVVKGINHIYPDLIHHLGDVKKINQNMLNRSTLLEYIYELWGIGGSYENKEVFGLNLEINEFNTFFPFVKLKLREFFKFNNLFKQDKKENLEDIGKNSFYNDIVKRFLNYLIDSVVNTLVKFGDLPQGFTYAIKKSEEGNFKIISNYKDALVSKSFINHINDIFSPVSLQRYMVDIFSLKNNDGKLEENRIQLALPNIVAKNEAYRDEIESNLSDIFLKIIYGGLYMECIKFTNRLNGFLIKMNLIFVGKSRRVYIIIFLLLGILSFIMLLYPIYLMYLVYFVIGLILFYCGLIILAYIFAIILSIYANIIEIILVILVLMWLFCFFILETYNDNAIELTNNEYLLINTYLSIFGLLLIYFVLLKDKFLIKDKLLNKFKSYKFKYMNKKIIKKRSQFTKNGINSDYINFIYLNSPDVQKDDYVGKKPFISGKIEKLWI